MFNAWCFFHLFLLLAFNVSGLREPAVGVLTMPIIQDSSPEALQAFSRTGVPVAVSVPAESLSAVSKSVLEAEKWVRARVLAHYPATNIAAVVSGGHSFYCRESEGLSELILPAMKNIRYSLTRWGLEGEIKVSAFFSEDCVPPATDAIPVLEFLRRTNSPYSVAPSSDLPISESIKNLGFPNLTKIHLTTEIQNHKPTGRKLSFYPFTDPVHLPPLVGTVTPPPLSLPIPPSAAPYGPHLPPCSPSGGVPSPAPALEQLWCVAKPNVPPETLKEALDYACGEGGADCEDIKPHGRCYYPNTIVAHASYAFNSYWQRSKRLGGTCGFEGTAMLINSDPSYRHCRFTIA